MATEPQRPIEKLLGDYARKRAAQAGPPPELHPADRRALQAEVRQQYAGADSRRRSGWFGNRWTWPRFAWTASFGLLLLLSIAVWQLQLHQPHQEKFAAMHRAEPTKSISLSDKSEADAGRVDATDWAKGETPAQNKPALAEMLAANSVQSPAIATNAADSYAAAQHLLAARSVAPPAASAPAPAPSSLPARAAPASAGKGLAYSEAASSDAARQQSLPAAGLAAATPSGVSEFSAFSNAADFLSTGDSSQAANQLGFAQSATQTTQAPYARRSQAAASAAPSGPVLAAFRFEQAGSQIRVIDRDGSVYAGYLEGSDSSARRKAVRLQVPTLARTADSLSKRAPTTALNLDAENQSGAFWVAGTNRSLNQAVFFSGHFLPWTNMPVTTKDAPAPAAASPNAAQSSEALPLQNLRISGTAEIGESGAMKIEANPAVP